MLVCLHAENLFDVILARCDMLCDVGISQTTFLALNRRSSYVRPYFPMSEIDKASDSHSFPASGFMV